MNAENKTERADALSSLWAGLDLGEKLTPGGEPKDACVIERFAAAAGPLAA